MQNGDFVNLRPATVCEYMYYDREMYHLIDIGLDDGV